MTPFIISIAISTVYKLGLLLKISYLKFGRYGKSSYLCATKFEYL